MSFSHKVTSSTTVFPDQKPVFVGLVCYLKSRVLSVGQLSAWRHQSVSNGAFVFLIHYTHGCSWSSWNPGCKSWTWIKFAATKLFLFSSGRLRKQYVRQINDELYKRVQLTKILITIRSLGMSSSSLRSFKKVHQRNIDQVCAMSSKIRNYWLSSISLHIIRYDENNYRL